MKRQTYDEFGRTRPLDVMGRCQKCGGEIKYHDRPIEMVHRTTGGPPVGIAHQYCPPRLVKEDR